MNLNFEREGIYRIDGIFCVKGGQTTDVPVVYIESENDVSSSYHEIKKLCMLNAPLKILMICTSWNESAEKICQIDWWDYIIEDFGGEIGLSGYLAIIIGDWDESLKFYSLVYNEEGDVVEDDPKPFICK